MELRTADPATLDFNDTIDPRQIPADRLSDAALKANIKAVGILQPPIFSEHEDGSLTIIAGRRRIRAAIALKLKDIAILVQPFAKNDDMRAVSENVVRAPMAPVDLWRSIESLASANWTEDAIAAAFALPLRQVKKLRLLGNILPEMLERIGQGDMPDERNLRVIASASLEEQANAWEANKPKKKADVAWHMIANALARRLMYARYAKFGEKEQTQFGIAWSEDLFAPANEDSRHTTDADAFLAAQRAWLDDNLPENGQIIDIDQYGGPLLPKGAERIWCEPSPTERLGHYIDPRTGEIRTVAFRLPKSTKIAGDAGGMNIEEIETPKTRADITGKGMEMIGTMRTEALHKALSRPDIGDHTLIALLTLALAGDNVNVRTGQIVAMRHLVSKIAEGGKLTADTALIRAIAIQALQAVLSCELKFNGSGLAARIAGDAIGADAELPSMATDEFLSSLSRAALERLGASLGVLPQGRVKDTRAAVIEQARESRLVLPQAQFVLSADEAAEFTREPYRYAGPGATEEHPDENDGFASAEDDADPSGGADPDLDSAAA